MLLLDFFEYYSNFDYESNCITIHTGVLPRATMSDNDDVDHLGPRLTAATAVNSKKRPLAVIDPFEVKKSFVLSFSLF